VCQYDDTLFIFEVSVNYIFAYSVLGFKIPKGQSESVYRRRTTTQRSKEKVQKDIFAYSVLVVTSITQNKPLVREYFGLFPYFLELSSYYIMTLKVRLYLRWFVGLMSYLRYLCYFRIVVFNIYCVVFLLISSELRIGAILKCFFLYHCKFRVIMTKYHYK
jgi:hypothetical protein